MNAGAGTVPQPPAEAPVFIFKMGRKGQFTTKAERIKAFADLLGHSKKGFARWQRWNKSLARQTWNDHDMAELLKLRRDQAVQVTRITSPQSHPFGECGTMTDSQIIAKPEYNRLLRHTDTHELQSRMKTSTKRKRKLTRQDASALAESLVRLKKRKQHLLDYAEAAAEVQGHTDMQSVVDQKTYTAARDKSEWLKKILPALPHKKYKDAGWQGWQTFTGRSKWATYAEAQQLVRGANIDTHHDFCARRPARVPARPDLHYKGAGFESWQQFFA